jgi:hypothetical protein
VWSVSDEYKKAFYIDKWAQCYKTFLSVIYESRMFAMCPMHQ